jgi:hypothetical protein
MKDDTQQPTPRQPDQIALPVTNGPVNLPAAVSAAWSAIARRLPVFGQPGVRDPDAPCAEFDPGDPDGECRTDGHYMCRECSHAWLCEGCDQIEDRCECQPDDGWMSNPALGYTDGEQP